MPLQNFEVSEMKWLGKVESTNHTEHMGLTLQWLLRGENKHHADNTDYSLIHSFDHISKSQVKVEKVTVLGGDW